MPVDTETNIEQLVSFGYTNLNEVDPSFDLLPEDVYTLKFIKGEKAKYFAKPGNKKGIPEGTECEYIKLNLAVTDNDRFAGRRVFPVLFPGNWTMKVLRRLSDKTGVPQEAEEPLDGWLARMSEIQPEFKSKIEFEKDRDGNVRLNEFGKPANNVVDWRTLLPVG